jgi:Domain of unknown function (DUF6457)
MREMSEWTDRLAEALTVEPLDPDDEARLLDASREIAHRVERKDTPLSSFLMGVAVGSMTATGMTRDEAIDEVFEDLARILPDLPAGPA